MMAALALLEQEPKRILLLGFGGGNLANFLFQLFPLAHLDLVEHDSAVVNATLQYMSFVPQRQHRNYTILIGEARLWMEQNREKFCDETNVWAKVTEESEAHQYDIIISDACGPPCELVTLESFVMMRDCLLKKEGVLIQNMFGWHVHLRMLRNLQEVFGEGLYAIGSEEKTPNTIFVGKKMPVHAPALRSDQILHRAKWFDMRHKHLPFNTVSILNHLTHAARPIVNTQRFTDMDASNIKK
jgi:hypothetical protein